MASAKKIGFFWGEEKMTVVEFDKDSPARVISSPLNSKTNTPTPFSSILNEEIQITAFLQKMLQDNRMTGGSFYVSLPMKEIVLRSFTIPNVKLDDIQNVIKYEAKKYVPFDIQDMAFVYHTAPIEKAQNKSLQVIFFAVRKEVLSRYQRIFSQANASVTYCEPAMVSLTKALLYRKEIKSTDNLAFLILDKDVGSICFIDQGIPQFIREFSLKASPEADPSKDPAEILNSKILNEVGNSFDFYSRQLSGKRIEQMLVSSESIQKDLLTNMERELKVKLRKFSLLVTTGVAAPSNDIEAIYAMGACVVPPLKPLSVFNFLEDKTSSKSIGGLVLNWESCKGIIMVFLVCFLSLIALYIYFQMQLGMTQRQYEAVSVQEGAYADTSADSIQSDLQQNSDKLAQYRNIRLKSDVALILYRVATHLPKGALLTDLEISYGRDDANSGNVSISIRGDVIGDKLNDQIPIVNQIFSEFKNDKVLLRYIKSVNLSSLNVEDLHGQRATGFVITCT